MAKKLDFEETPDPETPPAPPAVPSAETPPVFMVAPGKAFTTARGLVSEYETVSSRDFHYSEKEAAVGAEAFEHWKSQGYIVPKADKPES